MAEDVPAAHLAQQADRSTMIQEAIVAPVRAIWDDPLAHQHLAQGDTLNELTAAATQPAWRKTQRLPNCQTRVIDMLDWDERLTAYLAYRRPARASAT